MTKTAIPLRLKLRVSRRGIAAVIRRPTYNALIYVAFWLTLGLLVWLTNWRVLIDFLFDNNRGAGDKLMFFGNGYTSLVTNFSPLSAAILIVFSILSGLSAGLLVFVMSKSYKEALAGGSKNIVSVAAATVGAGCAACGTSFLAPLLTGVSGAASLTLTMAIGIVANVVGLVLLIYSIYRLGITSASLAAKDY